MGFADQVNLTDQNQKKWRRRVYDEVNGDLDSLWEYLVLYLIFCCSFLFIIGTLRMGTAPNGERHLPCLPGDDCQTLHDVYETPLEIFEAFAVIVFTLEWLLRIWSIVEDPQFGNKGAFWGRVSYQMTFFALVDFIVILPWWLEAAGLGTTDSLAPLRCVRLIRLLKTEKYLNSFGVFKLVIQENGVLLIAAGFYACMILVFSATALYFTESHSGLETQKHFSSIPRAMFPCLLMLTGEFPLADFTVPGQLVASAMAIIAVAFFAIPTGILGSGFIQVMESDEQQARFKAIRNLNFHSAMRSSFKTNIPQEDAIQISDLGGGPINVIRPAN